MHLHNRKPDIENLYAVLRREKPSRPTLFEMFLNDPLYEKLTGRKAPDKNDMLPRYQFLIDAFGVAGYDYATVYASTMMFQTAEHDTKKTISINEGSIITDEASYEAYQWPEPENYDYTHLDKIKPYLPDGMKLLVMGPGGVLENVTSLVGYDNLCYMVFENPELVQELFDQVGKRLLRYYEIALEFDSVGLIVSNDDWGFNTQTFFSPAFMRNHVFPWHKRIVDAAHRHNKPVVLHSCGYFNDVMEDTIQMGYDGKHSYEDNILSVEQSYDRWHDRIAIMGGIDVDFLIRSTPEDITARCAAMLEKAAQHGGYALGTGNSVPDYLPDDKYFAMIKTVLG